MKKIVVWGIFLLSTFNVLYAGVNQHAEKKMLELNAIVAVVNETPILQSTLTQRVMLVKKQLELRHIALPPEDILNTQVLNQLIDEQVQLQLADNRHIEVSREAVNAQLQKIADEQKVSLLELYQQAEQDGLTRAAYEQQVMDQMRLHELVQTTLVPKIVISDKDVALYRQSQLAYATAGKEYQVENIVIPLDASPTVAEVSAAEEKARQLLAQINRGAIAFDQAALRDSTGFANLQGGDLGFRPLAELPEIFAKAIVNMKVGDIAGPLRAANGFQLIKLIAIKNDAAALSDAEIREALFKRKLEEAYPLWLSSLKAQAYIFREPQS